MKFDPGFSDWSIANGSSASPATATAPIAASARRRSGCRHSSQRASGPATNAAK
jgi:hypothetical protein